jgi:hypothetical protein
MDNCIMSSCVIYTHQHDYCNDQTKKNGMGRAYGKHGVKRAAHVDFVWKPVEKSLLKRLCEQRIIILKCNLKK